MITSDKTIDGRGARVYIMEGAGLTLQYVNNVIIHNIYIKHIITGNGGLIRDSEHHIGLRTKSDGDGISLFGATNIWIDHVSMTRCADGMIDAIDGSTAVTISNDDDDDDDMMMMMMVVMMMMMMIMVVMMMMMMMMIMMMMMMMMMMVMMMMMMILVD